MLAFPGWHRTGKRPIKEAVTVSVSTRCKGEGDDDAGDDGE